MNFSALLNWTRTLSAGKDTLVEYNMLIFFIGVCFLLHKKVVFLESCWVIVSDTTLLPSGVKNCFKLYLKVV